MRRASSAVLSTLLTSCCALFGALVPPAIAAAQETGTVTGTVTRSGETAALSSVSVTVQSTGQSTVTAADGKYTLRRVPAGPQTIVFRWLGYRPTEVQRDGARPGGTATVDAAMEPVAIALTEIVVAGRLARAGAHRRGAGGDLGGAAGGAPEHLHHRPGPAGAADGARAWTWCRAASTTST